MPELDLLTEIHTDVKYIKTTLENHITDDKKIHRDFLLPLWEQHQQRKGAAKLVGLLYTVLGGLIVGAIDLLSKKNGG